MVAKSSTAETLPNPFLNALAAEASEAGLRYYSDARPGLTRKLKGTSFIYFQPDGRKVTDERTLLRIRRLAIPPAWTHVWICPHERGHLQATGRDAKGRKQYRYHSDWRAQRDDNKFGRMLAFAKALPRIRKRVKRDLQRRGLPREKVLATVVRLLEATLIRVGNDEYARDNKSYGLTTMRDRHVQIAGSSIKFAFRGKSGRRHEISLQDRQIAGIVKRCQEMPGQELFAYEDEAREPHDVGSHDVNAYLKEISGSDFTAKDFRTWAGTVLAAVALREFEAFTSQAQAKKNVSAAIEAVARMLGNTPAVCRKCYVHPEILNSYLADGTVDTLLQRIDSRQNRGSLAQLTVEETAVLALLQRRLAKSAANGTVENGSRSKKRMAARPQRSTAAPGD